MTATALQHDPSSANEAVTLSWLQIKGLKHNNDNTVCPVYGNGYQQTFVEVTLAAENAFGETVDISEAQMKTIKLIDYDTGKELIAPLSYVAERDEFHSRFDFYPERHLENAAEPASTAPVPATNSITFYLQSTTALTTRIGASFTLQSQTFTSNDAALLDNSGRVVSGRSNSSATIAAIAQNYTFVHTDFSLSDWTSFNQGFSAYKLIRLIPANYRIVYSLSGHDSRFVEDGDHSRALIFWAYSVTAKRDVHDETYSPCKGGDIIHATVNVESAAMYCLRYIYTHLDSSCKIEHQLTAPTLDIYDQNGNRHLIKLLYNIDDATITIIPA